MADESCTRIQNREQGIGLIESPPENEGFEKFSVCAERQEERPEHAHVKKKRG